MGAQHGDEPRAHALEDKHPSTAGRIRARRRRPAQERVEPVGIVELGLADEVLVLLRLEDDDAHVLVVVRDHLGAASRVALPEARVASRQALDKVAVLALCHPASVVCVSGHLGSQYEGDDDGERAAREVGLNQTAKPSKNLVKTGAWHGYALRRFSRDQRIIR